MNRTTRTVSAVLVSLSFLLPVVANAQPAPCTVNVNAATPAELQLLIRTGPVLAGRIVEARPLDAAKLDLVKGVGDAWLRDNGKHATFQGATTCTAKLKAVPAGE